MSAAVAVTSEDRTVIFNRIVDVATIVLISIAAVASAWCGYQASRWSGLQALDYSLANNARVMASVAATRASSARVLEVALMVQYESAVFNHNDAFAAFLYRRFPHELRTAVDAWLATKPLTNRNAPLSPFAMREYHERFDEVFVRQSRRADDLIRQAVAATRQSDDYVFLTVLFASVSFLGGVATKMLYARNFIITLLGAGLLLAAIIRVAQFPVR
jgi:hypothetical protein